jgi:predicted nucleotidyltransferase
MNVEREALLRKVKQAVGEVEPDAEIVLYGSQARGDSDAQSDWDFLILVNGRVTDDRVDRIRHRLYEVEWEFGEVLSSIVRNRQEWDSLPLSGTPFHRSVETEGVAL